MVETITKITLAPMEFDWSEKDIEEMSEVVLVPIDGKVVEMTYYDYANMKAREINDLVDKHCLEQLYIVKKTNELTNQS